MSIDFSGDGQLWKAGVSGVVITPETPMWMAGYASRVHPSDGMLHDLHAKALALESADGQQAVLVTTDLLGFPKAISDRIRDELEARFGLSRSQVILNGSHTHSGPVLEDALSSIYPLDGDHSDQISRYSEKLERQIITLVENALKVMTPARLYSKNGVARFQVNRRNNTEAVLAEQTELKGPNDHAVPVIKVETITGELMAVVFGYACHPTVLDIYKWSGDYAGFAQLELEKEYPGAKALFFQGACGDQNPLPRRTVALAKQYGRTLAAAVARVMDEDMPELSSALSVAYSEIKLPLTEPPCEEDLQKIMDRSVDFEGRCAAKLLQRLKAGEALPRTYDYPVQFWRLGDQSIVSLGGEVVIDYAIQLKKALGKELFVMAYSNDVMAYIPTVTILREGGYEADSSQMVYGLPSKWDESIEELILQEALRLAEGAGVATNNTVMS